MMFFKIATNSEAFIIFFSKSIFQLVSFQLSHRNQECGVREMVFFFFFLVVSRVSREMLISLMESGKNKKVI